MVGWIQSQLPGSRRPTTTDDLRERRYQLGPLALAGCCLVVAFLDPRQRNAVLVVLFIVVTHVVRRFLRPVTTRSERRLLVGGYVVATVAAGIMLLVSTRSAAITWTLVVATLGSALTLILRSPNPSTPALFVLRAQWLTWTLLAAATVAGTALIVRLLTGWPQHVTWIAVPVAIPLIIGSAAEKVPIASRFLPSLLWATVTLACLGVAVLTTTGVAVLGSGHLADAREREMLAWAALGAAAFALLYGPMRRALLSRADWAVYRGRPRPEALGHALAGSLVRTMPMEDTLRDIAEGARSALELARVSIWVEVGQSLQRIACDPPSPQVSAGVSPAALAALASAGARASTWLSIWIPDLGARCLGGDLRLVPIVSRGELLGALLGEQRTGDIRLADAHERTLRELALHLGPVLRSAKLDSALSESMTALREQARELRDSRARVVSVADAERRRIERDLHDGAQQHLIGLAFNLRAASELVRSDPAQAGQLLYHLEEASALALDELRALCQGVYPAALSISGIGPALGSAAARLPLAVQIDAFVPDRHPADVEAAIYFVCLEAIQNAVKHAGADATVNVTIQQQPASIRLTVTDDGCGFDTAAQPEGGGLANIRDRIGALGGTVEITSAPSVGTRVSAAVPVPAAKSISDRGPAQRETSARP